MSDVEELELLSESIGDEIDELQSMLENSDNVLLKAKKDSFQKQLRNVISNLESANDALYVVFECLNSDCGEDVKGKYDILHDILQDKLSYDEKVEIRIKYGIEFD